MEQNIIHKEQFQDSAEFIKYIGVSPGWVTVFKPTKNGLGQNTPIYDKFIQNNNKILNKIKQFDGKGIITLGINQRNGQNKSNKDITVIKNLVIDIDVKKEFKEGFVSPEHLHKLSIDTAYQIKEYLEEQGFQIGLIVDSGNGSHVYLKVDFERTYFEQIKEKIILFENSIRVKFQNEYLEIDKITKDINRRMKIPGTLNIKDTNQIENRESKILYTNTQDFEIQEITNSNLIEVLKPTKTKPKVLDDKLFENELNKALRMRKIKKLFDGNIDSYESRSEAELGLIGLLCSHSDFFWDYDIIDEIMNLSHIGKWGEKPESYRKLTFEKALKKYHAVKDFSNRLKQESFEDVFGFEIYYIENEKQERKYALVDEKGNLFYHSHTSLVEALFHRIKTQELENDINETMKIIRNTSKNKAIRVDSIGYFPHGSKIFEYDNKKFLNIYQKPEILFQEIREGEFPNIKHLILHLCNDDENKYNWLVQRIAYILQKPEDKLSTALVVITPQGAGKNLFFEKVLKPIFGKDNCEVISQSILDGRFNSYLRENQIIIANEIKYNEFSNNDSLTEKLKAEVTDEHVNVEQKGRDAITVRNFTNWFFFTNNLMSIRILEDNRRFTVFRNYTKIPKEWVVNFFIPNIEKELLHFVYYLQNLEIDRVFVDTPLQTKEGEEIKELYTDSLRQFVNDLEEVGSFNLMADNYSSRYNVHRLYVGQTYVKCDDIEKHFKAYCKEYSLNSGSYGRKHFLMRLKELFPLMNSSKVINEGGKSVRGIMLSDLGLKPESHTNETWRDY